jgi:hypothetical protein
MAKHKYIESPEKLWEYFQAYVKDIKARPFKVKDWVGKDGDQIEREKERPLTIEGFENYCFEHNIISDLGKYFANSDNAYSEFRTICSRIRQVIRQDQIEGGMAGMYNPSITQRLNGLTDKSEQVVEVKTYDVSLKL